MAQDEEKEKKPTTRAPLMAAESERPKSGRSGADRASFERHAAIGLWAAAALLLVGTAIDLGTLWVLQRQAVPTWEFVAIGNTIEAYPRIMLGIGLLFPALYFQRWTSLKIYRTLSALLLLLGIGALTLGVLEVTDYLVLRQQASPQALPVLRSTALKAVTLSGAFFVILTTLGLFGWRRPRSS